MTHNAMMIDLETLALANNAAIVQGAAIVTDLDDPMWNYKTPIISSKIDIVCQQFRRIDPVTLTWHINKGSGHLDQIFTGDKILLRTFLLDITEAITLYSIDTVWSKGVDFDIVILEHAYEQEELDVPWNYRQKRCFRTILAEDTDSSRARNNPYMADHTAQSDAFNQMFTLWDIKQRLPLLP